MWKGGLPVHQNIQNKEDQHQSHQYSLFKNKFVSPYQIILYNDEKEPPSRRMMVMMMTMMMMMIVMMVRPRIVVAVVG